MSGNPEVLAWAMGFIQRMRLEAGSAEVDPAPAVAPSDPLVRALAEASAAGQWAVVQRLAGELEARRLDAAPTNVVDLTARRRRRGTT